MDNVRKGKFGEFDGKPKRPRRRTLPLRGVPTVDKVGEATSLADFRDKKRNEMSVRELPPQLRDEPPSDSKDFLEVSLGKTPEPPDTTAREKLGDGFRKAAREIMGGIVPYVSNVPNSKDGPIPIITPKQQDEPPKPPEIA